MDAYALHRANYGTVSGQAVVATADTATVTLVTAKTGWTVFIQRLMVTILTSAGQTLTFQDSANTPVVVEATDSAPGADTQYLWDFGSRGKGLTEAKNFAMAISGAGLAAHIEWEGYIRQTGNENVAGGVSGAGDGKTGQQFV